MYLLIVVTIFSIQTDEEDQQKNNLSVSTFDTTMAIVSHGTTLQYDDLSLKLRARILSNKKYKCTGQDFGTSNTSNSKRRKNDDKK